MSEKVTASEAESAGSEPLDCLRCGGAMTQGFVIDNTHHGNKVAKWVPGAPQRSFWAGIKVLPESLPIGAFRCTACGRLELFADEIFDLR